ncbi:hypothetical protein F5Y16DRAFT_397751 [Xylariaceae sp. FL0255]|nr:hypothetical protein F5Y16DRAFT_397751 [Xylariaceae sp. FL0255]
MPRAFRKPDFDEPCLIMDTMPGRYIYVPLGMGEKMIAEVRRRTKEAGQRVYVVMDAHERGTVLGYRVPTIIFDTVRDEHRILAKDSRVESIKNDFSRNLGRLCPGMPAKEREKCLYWTLDVSADVILPKYLDKKSVRRCTYWLKEYIMSVSENDAPLTADERRDRIGTAMALDIYVKYTLTDYVSQRETGVSADLALDNAKSQMKEIFRRWGMRDQVWCGDWSKELPLLKTVFLQHCGEMGLFSSSAAGKDTGVTMYFTLTTDDEFVSMVLEALTKVVPDMPLADKVDCCHWCLDLYNYVVHDQKPTPLPGRTPWRTPFNTPGRFALTCTIVMRSLIGILRQSSGVGSNFTKSWSDLWVILDCFCLYEKTDWCALLAKNDDDYDSDNWEWISDGQRKASWAIVNDQRAAFMRSLGKPAPRIINDNNANNISSSAGATENRNRKNRRMKKTKKTRVTKKIEKNNEKSSEVVSRRVRKSRARKQRARTARAGDGGSFVDPAILNAMGSLSV